MCVLLVDVVVDFVSIVKCANIVSIRKAEDEHYFKNSLFYSSHFYIIYHKG